MCFHTSFQHSFWNSHNTNTHKVPSSNAVIRLRTRPTCSTAAAGAGTVIWLIKCCFPQSHVAFIYLQTFYTIKTFKQIPCELSCLQAFLDKRMNKYIQTYVFKFMYSNLGIELEFKGIFSSVLNGAQPWLL